MKLQTWLNEAREALSQAGILTSALDARLLLEYSLGKSHEWIVAHSETVLDDETLTSLNNYLAQRVSHTPLAYIVGSKEFYGRAFIVSSSVLIPRPESEAMIDLLLELRIGLKDKTIVDIGTGAGCLAITAQLELPKTTVIATDISEDALYMANSNAKLLQAPVQFYNADLLNLPDAVKPDVILANLPYVPDNLVTSEEIKKEPFLALFSGNDGLDHYKTMWQQLHNRDYAPTYIITESLTHQHQALEELAQAANYTLQTTKDLAQLFIKN